MLKKKYLILSGIILFILTFAGVAWGNDDQGSLSVKIEQKLPETIFLNDVTSQEYSFTITNTGETITGKLEISVTLPGSGFADLEIKNVQYDETKFAPLENGEPRAGTYTFNKEENTFLAYFGTSDEDLIFASEEIFSVEYEMNTKNAKKLADFGDNTLSLRVSNNSQSEMISEDISNLIKPGALSVLLELAEDQSEVIHKDDLVSIRAIIQNLGEGALFDTKVSLNIEKYEFDLVPEEGVREGKEWSKSFDILNPKEEKTYDFVIKVIDKEEFELALRGSNKAYFEKSIEDKDEYYVIDHLPITFAAKHPKIALKLLNKGNSYDIEVPFGQAKEVTIEITNSGEGAARGFQLVTNGIPSGSHVEIKEDEENPSAWRYENGIFYYELKLPEDGENGNLVKDISGTQNGNEVVELQFSFGPPTHESRPTAI